MLSAGATWLSLANHRLCRKGAISYRSLYVTNMVSIISKKILHIDGGRDRWPYLPKLKVKQEAQGPLRSACLLGHLLDKSIPVRYKLSSKKIAEHLNQK